MELLSAGNSLSNALVLSEICLNCMRATGAGTLCRGDSLYRGLFVEGRFVGERIVEGTLCWGTDCRGLRATPLYKYHDPCEEGAGCRMHQIGTRLSS